MSIYDSIRYSAYDVDVDDYTVSQGQHLQPNFSEQVIDGERLLVETGKTDLHEFIQASLADTLVYNVLERYGGVDAYAQFHPVEKVLEGIQDFTLLPKTLAESQQMMIDASNRFDSFPAELRSMFGNSVDRFINELSNGQAVDKIKSILEPYYNRYSGVSKNVESEVKSDA